jgi:hypothetical protein
VVVVIVVLFFNIRTLERFGVDDMCFHRIALAQHGTEGAAKWGYMYISITWKGTTDDNDDVDCAVGFLCRKHLSEGKKPWMDVFP